MKRNEIKEKLTEFIEDESAVKGLLDYIFCENGKDIESYKSQINDLSAEIETHKSTLDDLNDKLSKSEKLTEENSGLKLDLENWANKYNDLMATRKTEKEDAIIRDKLSKDNCTDIDFAIYKIGRENFVFSSDGDLIGYDDTVKDFKTEHADFFATTKPIIDDPNTEPLNNGVNIDLEFEKLCNGLGW